jgi:4-hydroxybenzoate polyprenyltransferase
MLWHKIYTYNRLIVLAHSVFALPFALWGYVLGSTEVGFSWEKLFWVLVAVVSARTSAMAFNRYIDRDWDARNPRTQNREIPQGLVHPKEALALSFLSALLFLIAAWMLSPICAMLAPVALIILLGYSYTKRFTALSHFVLGAALGLAPVGAYLAVRESFALESILIGLAVLFWVAGFDILYALQDMAFDREVGLHSIPAALGEWPARLIAIGCHILATFLLAYVGLRLYSTHPLYWIGWALFSLFVLRQHWVARHIPAINRAFFTYNGWASLLLSSLAITASLT